MVHALLLRPEGRSPRALVVETIIDQLPASLPECTVRLASIGIFQESNSPRQR
jgi:hypothetical protein